MRVSRNRLARELVRLIVDNPQRQSQFIQQAAAYLIANKQTNQADLLVKDIARELARLGHVSAIVETARPLTNASRQVVKKRLQTEGVQTVELTEYVLPELLGGIVIRTADTELDTSVRTKLNQISRLGV